MKDSVFRVYDQYAINGRKIEDISKSLVEGTESSNYLRAMHLLRDKGAALSKEELSFIKGYCKNHPGSEADKIRLRLDFLKYDSAASAEEKDKMLGKIAKKRLHLSFNQERPPELVLQTPSSEKKEEGKTHEPLLDFVDVDKELEQIYTKQMSLGNFWPEALCDLKYDRLSKSEFLSLISVMGPRLAFVESEAFFKVWAMYLKADKKPSTCFFKDKREIEHLTLKQMQKLLSHIPELSDDYIFIVALASRAIAQEFGDSLGSVTSPKEMREILLKLYRLFQTFFLKLNSYFLLELLANGIKLGLYERNILEDYLKRPAPDQLIALTSTKSANPEVAIFLQLIESGLKLQVDPRKMYDKEIVAKYIEHFLREGVKIEDLMASVDQYCSREEWEDMNFMLGKKVELTSKNTERLEKLAKKVSIRFCEDNPEAFSIGEDVALNVELKNVPSLFIKIFEINTENYYRKNMAAFRTDVNLDGLVASFESNIEFKEAPQIKFRKTLALSELKGKAGLFVVELIGSGKSSRAILKIGSLSLIATPTAKGHACFILDGEKKICVGENTGIWMDNELFPADSTGAIAVPYLPFAGELKKKTLLLHKVQAQLVDFTRTGERYSLECGFFLLPESFLMGNKASILLRPQLKINGRFTDLSLLKNVRCVLLTTSSSEGIPVTQTFSELQVSEEKELIVTFQVAANVNNMHIELLADVDALSRGVKEHLKATHSFKFSGIQENSIVDLYLKLTKEKDYVVFALGKNGEPFANLQVSFKLRHEILRYEVQKQGTTDEQGAILLGKLAGINSIIADVTQSVNNAHKVWVLPSLYRTSFPDHIDILEGEEVKLSFSKEAVKHKPRLFSWANVDLSHLINVTPQADSAYGVLKASKLTCGKYSLYGVGDKHIEIAVHKGAYWKPDPNYLELPYSLAEAKKNSDSIRVKEVLMQEEKEQTRMKISIEGGSSSSKRVHVLLFQYLPENLNEIAKRFLRPPQDSPSQAFMQKWKNFYLSNRELSSEFRYCFDRKRLPRFTGNSLEKPRLLLKRNYIQTTEANDEVVNEGTKYSAEDEAKVSKTAHSPAYVYHSADIGREKSSKLEASIDKIPTLQNFLGKPPITLFNLKADKDGVLLIEMPSNYKEEYGLALIIAVDSDSVSHYLHPLQSLKPAKRDLSVLTPLDSKKSYCEMRTTKCLQKYSTHTINDYSSTEMQVIDSLPKALLAIKEIMTLEGGSVAELSEFESLLEWDRMSEEKKNQTVSQIASHELHLFIYKKDPEYFRKVVRPYLMCKMEKSFIDYFLLEDAKVILEYATSTPALSTMNSLEKALLVESLVKQGKKDLAVPVLNSLKSSALKSKLPTIQLNKMFDTILSMNALKESTEGIFIAVSY